MKINLTLKYLVSILVCVALCGQLSAMIKLAKPIAIYNKPDTQIRAIVFDHNTINHVCQPKILLDGTVSGLHLYHSASDDLLIDLGQGLIIVTDNPEHVTQCHNGYVCTKNKSTQKTFFPSGLSAEKLPNFIETCITQGLTQNAVFAGPVDKGFDSAHQNSPADYNLWVNNCVAGEKTFTLQVSLASTRSPGVFSIVSAYPRPDEKKPLLDKKHAWKLIEAYENAKTPLTPSQPPASPEDRTDESDYLNNFIKAIEENNCEYIRANSKKIAEGSISFVEIAEAVAYEENKREAFESFINLSSQDERKLGLRLAIEKRDPTLASLLLENDAPVSPGIKEAAKMAGEEIWNTVSQYEQ